MRIDPTIYAALDAGTLTIDRFLETLGPVFEAAETPVLIDVAAAAVAAGFLDADVKLMIEQQAHRLRERRGARLETIRQMLEARATNLQ